MTIIIYGNLFVFNTYQAVTRHSKQISNAASPGAEQAHGKCPITPQHHMMNLHHMNSTNRIKIFLLHERLNGCVSNPDRKTGKRSWRSVGIGRSSAANKKETRKISSEVKPACSLANVLRHLVAPSFLIWRPKVISLITDMNIFCPLTSIRTLEAVCCMPV